MKVIVQPSGIRGEVHAAASKSSMQRACAAALLHAGETYIHNPGQSDDDTAALSVIEKLGAVVTGTEDGTVVVRGAAFHSKEAIEINCGESGLSIRMFAPIAALYDAEVTVTGRGSLLNRPMDFFDEVFPQLGIAVRSSGGRLPLTIQGPLQPADISIDGSLSSQFLTGLLMAFAAATTEKRTILVHGLKSRPYIDLTLRVMEHFGYSVVNHAYASFDIFPAGISSKEIHYTVEGDWSGAAFLLVAGAIAGEVTVKGLDVFSAQADKAVLQALMMAKARVSIAPEAITISAGTLQPFHFNATDCPDLFPPLAALAAFCEGTSVIEGVSRLAHKESNRALTLQEEFGKMGIRITLQDDLMLVEGGTPLAGAIVHSHHDHRIAMACAVAALRAEGNTCIEEAEAINKSYPGFYKHLQSLGAGVTIVH